MEFRGMSIPVGAPPLVIGALAHGSFRASLRKFIRGLVMEHKDACIPLHVPRVGIVEGRWKTLGSQVHNFRTFTRNWQQGEIYECVCSKHSGLHEKAWSSDGHVAVPGHRLVDISSQAVALASRNSNDTLFPTQGVFKESLVAAALKFWRDNRMGMQPWGREKGLRDKLLAWVESQWPLHCQALHEQGEHVPREVREIRKVYGDLVWHCADHKHTCMVGYCPLLYSRLLASTFFENPEVFQVESFSPSVAHVILQQSLPSGLRGACP